MRLPPDEIKRRLRDLLDRLAGRAAGAWRVVEGVRVDQIGFVSAPDLPEGVALGFAEATRSVNLARVELAIARAAATGEVVVSIADELPASVGSGYWLRAFGASRSVAVPVAGEGGRAALVVSVALGPAPDWADVAGAIRDAGWGDPPPAPLDSSPRPRENDEEGHHSGRVGRGGGTW